jgi:adenylate kinase family enzyme
MSFQNVYREDKILENTRVFAFVGPSGTGKSYRAQMVASENNIQYIIDDGLLIKNNDIVVGNSAKKAATKIETVRKALFIEEPQRKEMVKALKKQKPESILILGTSENMVNEIAKNLELPKIEKIIYITDVATEEEIEDARRVRTNEGKHVIPVPTFEIKKDFSGYILDPLQIFKTRKDTTYMDEKSIIRPTFSYMGNYTISDVVFKEIIEYQARKNPSITNVLKVRVTKGTEEPSIYVEVEVKFGINIITELRNFKEKCTKEIERQTSMTVKDMRILAKKISLPS